MRTVTAILAICMLVVTGCGRQASPSPDAPAPVDPGAHRGLAPLSEVGLKRVIDRPAVQNDLRQLALFYKTYEAEFGSVKSADALKNYIKRDAPKLYQALDEKVYVVVPNVRAASGSVVAYEKTADAAQQHIVAMGDATISQMSTAELQAALKKQGS